MNTGKPARTCHRLLLILEFIFGLGPLLLTYLYHVPIGIFWTRRVLELASEGIGNAYTAGIAIAFIAGGIGLLGISAALLSRLIGRPISNALALAAIWIGIIAGAALLVFRFFDEGFWSDYYLLGAPVLVGIHHLVVVTRSGPRRLGHAPA